jgi:hypothetical protein
MTLKYPALVIQWIFDDFSFDQIKDGGKRLLLSSRQIGAGFTDEGFDPRSGFRAPAGTNLPAA